ncbi:COBRA-like protein 1 isoform X2 [Nicotiana tomentosiformis]|uniref:COBRA-like protein 1 isoform X2 n=1 Tax=Nicotiana tomentosiformis TaxID=4098 RepID=UPI00051B1E7A
MDVFSFLAFTQIGHDNFISKVVVSIYNFQKYPIQAPGWQLGWTWAKQEIIWSVLGGLATEKGDCSRFEGNIPHCCKRDPTFVDMTPQTPPEQQIENCCKGGVIKSWLQDPGNGLSGFQMKVGHAGTNKRRVRRPKRFSLKAVGVAYICREVKKVEPSKKALMTWRISCIHSHILLSTPPPEASPHVPNPEARPHVTVPGNGELTLVHTLIGVLVAIIVWLFILLVQIFL